jgi:hypothetical protein
VWKNFTSIFHTMENNAQIFPQRGKKFSTVWKTIPLGGMGKGGLAHGWLRRPTDEQPPTKQENRKHRKTGMGSVVAAPAGRGGSGGAGHGTRANG